ncbi:hydrolase [Thioclava sp. SK-1]|uniref:HAD family hydrolase n=1 Tax=Thioclava sp. SK-1 TaxID=1889770 RepID=UPI00082662FA|nr:HAD family phosphatase [Thioclava sp. SK-1]OCX65843.1 hydrolase [Thioclava sp. SK-1]
MTVKAVLFDCDGVLVDSEPPTFALLHEDFTRYGLSLDPQDMEPLFIGGTIEGCAAKARDMGATLPDNWAEDFYQRLYVRLRTNTPLIPGIPALLDRLDAANIGYAVGSNGRLAKMDATLGQHPAIKAKLEGRLFSGQETVSNPKPAPDLYLHCAKVLGVDPSDCVVIEDSATGAQAAANAGIPCWGYAPHGDNPALAATGARLFHDMAQLPALIGLRD